MKRIAPFALILVCPSVWADLSSYESEDTGYVGPARADVELLEVYESRLSGAKAPLTVRIKNHSDYYVDRIAVDCEVTDTRGFRVFESLVFKSAPSFSIRLQFPPITTPEMGIPPGAAAEVELYTSDNRWTRGHGEYTYDCETYGVSGGE